MSLGLDARARARAHSVAAAAIDGSTGEPFPANAEAGHPAVGGGIRLGVHTGQNPVCQKTVMVIAEPFSTSDPAAADCS